MASYSNGPAHKRTDLSVVDFRVRGGLRRGACVFETDGIVGISLFSRTGRGAARRRYSRAHRVDDLAQSPGEVDSEKLNGKPYGHEHSIGIVAEGP